MVGAAGVGAPGVPPPACAVAVARAVAFVPDLLFGSKVLSMLEAAGVAVTLCAGEAEVSARLPGADVLVVDLATGTIDGEALLETLRTSGALDGVRTLAFYSHVEAQTRAAAQRAGFDVVVPRSRMAREGGVLVAALAAADKGSGASFGEDTP